jgi:hypothetical protein
MCIFICTRAAEIKPVHSTATEHGKWQTITWLCPYYATSQKQAVQQSSHVTANRKNVWHYIPVSQVQNLPKQNGQTRVFMGECTQWHLSDSTKRKVSSTLVTTHTPCDAPFPENTALYGKQIHMKGTKPAVRQWLQQQPKEFFSEEIHWQVHQWVGCLFSFAHSDTQIGFVSKSPTENTRIYCCNYCSDLCHRRGRANSFNPADTALHINVGHTP